MPGYRVALGLSLFIGVCAAGCASSAEPAPEPAPAAPNQKGTGANACAQSSLTTASWSSAQSCGWGCTDTCTSQAIGEPGGPFYCDTPTSCGIWPWCPTATLVTGPLDSPQCECQCK